MSEDEKAADEAASDVFSKGTDHLYASAKWLIVVFAAIGGVLVAGTQLSSLGQLEWGSVRLTMAIIAALVALLSIGVAVFFVVRVLISGYTALGDLASKPANSHEIMFLTRNKIIELMGYDSVSALYNDYQGVAGKRKVALKEYYELLENPSKKNEADKKREELERLDARLQYLDAVNGQVLSAVRYHSVRRAFKWAVGVLFVTGAIAAGAIGIFAWAANPTAPEKPGTSPSAKSSGVLRSA